MSSATHEGSKSEDIQLLRQRLSGKEKEIRIEHNGEEMNNFGVIGDKTNIRSYPYTVN